MPEHNAELENRVRKLLLDAPFAVFTTVGEDGRPYSRWMSPILVTGNLKEVHTLAGPASRKVAHLRRNPSVTWLFNRAQFEEVVTLHGTATVEEDPILRAEIWEAMPNKQRSFILNNDDNLDFVIIRTDVEKVEYLEPLTGETVPRTFVP